MFHSNIDFQVTNIEQPETQGEYKPNGKEFTLFSTAESDRICVGIGVPVRYIYPF